MPKPRAARAAKKIQKGSPAKVVRDMEHRVKRRTSKLRRERINVENALADARRSATHAREEAEARAGMNKAKFERLVDSSRELRMDNVELRRRAIEDKEERDRLREEIREEARARKDAEVELRRIKAGRGGHGDGSR